MKIYKDSDGRVKGDALICYLMKESVSLAISLLDGADFRPGHPLKVSVVCLVVSYNSEALNGRLKIAQAQFVSKPDLPKKRKKRSKKVRVIDQKKYANNLQFGYSCLFRELDWDEAENVNVVLQHMFDPKESWVCLANY